MTIMLASKLYSWKMMGHLQNVARVKPETTFKMKGEINYTLISLLLHLK